MTGRLSLTAWKTSPQLWMSYTETTLFIGMSSVPSMWFLFLPAKIFSLRDIHPNNVLVATLPTPRDASTSTEIELVLMGLGESRASHKEQSIGRKYYGNVGY
jgi:hypothetical protein